ncbi:TauD/TfdA dioxygenase family protein [Actinophytocola oryzae]|uniref:Taurine dioxygenase n=1 Tax=Actinophytocola oryzae TaxID=502181 RepID=A0A4R7V6Q5_9PSEU|nr:TauD/TfdA family dioxygenase [Actinophytocola oryzae]TDV43715.1 taurine dioxygenase [Actinophytocola oryzae]
MAAMLGVRPAAGYIGAYVDNVDLSSELDDATIAELRRLLLTHKVLFFREQRLDHAAQVEFGQRFGPLAVRARQQDTDDLAQFPQILTISPQLDRKLVGADYEAVFRSRWASSISGWHVDTSQVVNPPAIAFLRAEAVPPFGGDTQWTNLVAAYNGLSAPLQKLCDGLHAEHSFWPAQQLDPSVPKEKRAIDMIGNRRVAVHPVVRVHPENGEKALFVNPSRTARIMGMNPVESRHLLGLLFEELTRPQYTVRFSWEAGSVAVWDNRSTAHLAATDIDHLDGAVRIMHRISTVGDIPVGPDGFTSYAVAGDPLDEPAATAHTSDPVVPQ